MDQTDNPGLEFEFSLKPDDDAELSQVRPDRVERHGALAHQKIAGPMQDMVMGRAFEASCNRLVDAFVDARHQHRPVGRTRPPLVEHDVAHAPRAVLAGSAGSGGQRRVLVAEVVVGRRTWHAGRETRRPPAPRWWG